MNAAKLTVDNSAALGACHEVAAKMKKESISASSCRHCVKNSSKIRWKSVFHCLGCIYAPGTSTAPHVATASRSQARKARIAGVGARDFRRVSQ
jgi:hypothetical protein